MAGKTEGNGRSDGDLVVAELVITHDGKSYKINHGNVTKAFNNADYGEFNGPLSRYVLVIDGEYKTVVSVFGLIVPIKSETLTEAQTLRISRIFESLGLTVLDKHSHHV